MANPTGESPSTSGECHLRRSGYPDPLKYPYFSRFCTPAHPDIGPPAAQNEARGGAAPAGAGPKPKRGARFLGRRTLIAMALRPPVEGAAADPERQELESSSVLLERSDSPTRLYVEARYTPPG